MLFDHREHFKKIYGLEAPPQLEYFGVFINSIKCDESEFLSEFASFNPQKIDENFFVIKNEFKDFFSKSEMFSQGKIYIQENASFLCAKSLGARAGEMVLDMCAAPGGKSINLANFMKNSGYLACNELNQKRFFLLKKMLENYGVNAKIFNHDGVKIGKKTPLFFDKILLDAPCSTFMHDFSIEKSQKEIKQIALTQKKLLNSALAALKNGGELIYSTCTHNFYENEAVIFNALHSKFELEILPIDGFADDDYLPGLSEFNSKFSDPRLKNCYRILPNEFRSAFFVTKLRKIGEKNATI